MSSTVQLSTLKEINAYKKKINWGDVPAIYHMVSTSLGDLEGILTHGFDSAYKRMLNTESWNMAAFAPMKDLQGNVTYQKKPQISLRHEYNDMGYELHCYPVINGEIIRHSIENNLDCPFIRWSPESMQMLFRVNSLVAFSIFCYQNGDEADIALLKQAHQRVEQLVTTLSKYFQITSVKGYNIAEFYQEIARKNGNILLAED
ncbi:hypothetical protein KO495_05760 [Colwellia sp. D2M02]|uniref:hypothetical protein n=1 Tax=Colwellia sp. D2M02 TaxID=2841562 RepID=UPI001C0816BD|nr:hypothetical protein [Colwellia sp. D2M02]MBU2892827.1 hypothetical protein [Colwellia sp. D2M02]